MVSEKLLTMPLLQYAARDYYSSISCGLRITYDATGFTFEPLLRPPFPASSRRSALTLPAILCLKGLVAELALACLACHTGIVFGYHSSLFEYPMHSRITWASSGSVPSYAWWIRH
jgi:hypothetical protein